MRNLRIPLLVTFTNLVDPESAQKVEPGDLETAFGTGHILKPYNN
jgi:hypothetical protein